MRDNPLRAFFIFICVVIITGLLLGPILRQNNIDITKAAVITEKQRNIAAVLEVWNNCTSMNSTRTLGMTIDSSGYLIPETTCTEFNGGG